MFIKLCDAGGDTVYVKTSDVKSARVTFDHPTQEINPTVRLRTNGGETFVVCEEYADLVIAFLDSDVYQPSS